MKLLRRKPDPIVRPWDAEDTQVILNLDKRWQVAWSREGRYPEAFGPAYETPGEAIHASQKIREQAGLG